MWHTSSLRGNPGKVLGMDPVKKHMQSNIFCNYSWTELLIEKQDTTSQT